MQGMFVWLEWQDQHLWGTTNCTELRLTDLTTTEKLETYPVSSFRTTTIYFMWLIIARTTCAMRSHECMVIPCGLMTLHLLFDEPYTMGKNKLSLLLLACIHRSSCLCKVIYNGCKFSIQFNFISFTFEGNLRACSLINVSTISKNSKVAGGSGISV